MSDELLGKARADLRNEQLRKLIGGWELKRDELYDEIAHRKGQVELLEELVKSTYERVLDINKEEQQKETVRIEARVEELKKQAAVDEENKRLEEAKVLHLAKQEKSLRKKTKEAAAPKDPVERIQDTQQRMRNKE